MFEKGETAYSEIKDTFATEEEAKTYADDLLEADYQDDSLEPEPISEFDEVADAKPKRQSKEWSHVEHEAESHDLLRNEVHAYCVKMRKDPEYKAKLEAFFREITEGLGVVVEVHIGS